ncbi:hypothetical protein GYB22_13095 [bacterium]|nr:hypothetical protein [bacterium]
MTKQKDPRKIIITKVRKGRISRTDLKALIKYKFNEDQREYILAKLPKQYKDIAYCNPLPKEEIDIGAEKSVYITHNDTVNELNWYINTLKVYSNELKKFNKLQHQIERAIACQNVDKLDDINDKLINDVSFSIYSLVLEIYLNNLTNNVDDNESIMTWFADHDLNKKIPILLEFAKLRTSAKVPAWQYDSTIDHHKKLYPENNDHLIEYLVFKIDPINFNFNFTHSSFILSFDFELPIIDRLISLKRLFPHIIQNLSTSEIKSIADNILNLSDELNDQYWNKLLVLFNHSELRPFYTEDFQQIHDEVADLFLLGKYKEVIKACSMYIKSHPELVEIQRFLVRSLILANVDLDDYVDSQGLSYQQIKLTKQVLEKGSTYAAERDQIIDLYYSNSFYNLSNCLLLDGSLEYQFEVPKSLVMNCFLNSHVLSDRYLYLFKVSSLEKLTCLNTSKWLNLIIKSVESDTPIDLSSCTYYEIELFTNTKILTEEYQEASSALDGYYNRLKGNIPEFIKTWYIKNKSLCLTKTGRIDEAVNLLVNEYFNTGIFYDHYFNQEIIDTLLSDDESVFYKDIAVPIFFNITKQSQSICYDSIANFLIQHNHYKPSDLKEGNRSHNKKHLTYFLERCCTKANIEDSPFLNSIEALSSERIYILNYLKEINPGKKEIYNEEILDITKENTIRKGVQHIHESRIFVDTDSLFSISESQIQEIFERYLSIDNSISSSLSILTLEDIISGNKKHEMFYCKEPVSDDYLDILVLPGIHMFDDNIVHVSMIRYNHFISLFDEIRDQFVFNEEFGFKSFLSMRIRHGTFSNVIRNVFDKFHLISSKKSSSDEYKPIAHWNDVIDAQPHVMSSIQACLENSSRTIDDLIDKGLSWIKVVEDKNDTEAIFNFNFSELELQKIFINEIGRITNHGEFINSIFNILYVRLEVQLEKLRTKLIEILLVEILEVLDSLHGSLGDTVPDQKIESLLAEQIIACRTEVQHVLNQVTQWFKLSQNHYVDEFQIDMILDTTIGYTNSIHGDILSRAQVTKNINCSSTFKGKFFEGFGDIFINIFDNIIKNNKDLNSQLHIDINVESENAFTKIKVTNNLSKNMNIKTLKQKIIEISQKVSDYKNHNIPSSFEGDSGYLKICRCISADLEQDDYEVKASYEKNKFIVSIEIKNSNLVI